MSGCHCGQAGSMFCESCSDLECREYMEHKEDMEKQKALERQKEREEWNKFNKELENEKKEFLNYLYSTNNICLMA